MEPKTKSDDRKKLKMKTDMLRRTVKEAGGVCGISPEEEDYEGSAKRKASNLV